MNKRLYFSVDVPFDGRRCRARPATRADIEPLRAWKNANRSAFFHKEEIGAEAQRRWFEDFSGRPGEQMFVLELEGRPIGCVGFRFVRDGVVDLFNLILGDPAFARRGLMSAFYRALEPELARTGVRSIELEVLADNAAAIAFYRKHGFVGDERSRDGASLALRKAVG